EGAHGVGRGAPRVGGVVAKAGDVAGAGVVAVEARLEGPHPEDSLAVLVDALEVVVGEAVGVVRIVAQDAEAVAVVAVEPVFGGEPEEADPVLEDALDDALRESLVERDALELERVAPGG